MKNKSEEWIIAVMKRFACPREEALTAPDNILDIIPEKPLPLSKAEMNYALKIIKKQKLKIKGD